MEWIDVNERLPEVEMAKVLVFCEGGNKDISFYIKDREHARRYHTNSNGGCSGYSRKSLGKESCHFDIAHKYSYKITHWMPMPSDPEE